MKTDINDIKTWILPKPINHKEIPNCSINFTLQKILRRRGVNLEEDLDNYITPSELPKPEDHFNQLNKATYRIVDACNRNEKIAICGDYDADGITSTVLLVELLTMLGAQVSPYIPSRKNEGYGLNTNMIKEINVNDIKLVITVDNGISAFEAIKASNELGIDLIITDHHKIPIIKPDVFALIHPEKVPHNSPYKYLAGVGIAYILATSICKKLNFDINLTSANDLFCIGTVADMAPLKGANRKWLKEFLPKLGTTKNTGMKLIFKKLSIDNIDITTDDIGFKIAPLINAIGRIGNPQLIIDLFTTSSDKTLKKLINDCLAINKERKRLTSLSESEAMEIALSEYSQNTKFLVISKKDWNPGIIGIIAARLADKFNLPTAILSSSNNGIFRGSIRSNNLLNVNTALNQCKDILIAYGGHSAAAGFTIKEENITSLKCILNKIATRELNSINLDKSIKPDSFISFKDINYTFYNQLMLIGPFGINNPTPIFWTRKCRVISTYKLKGNHLKMKLEDETGVIDAIKWKTSLKFKKNDLIDIAYKIEVNNWNTEKKLQINIVDIKRYNNIIDLTIHKRKYKCQLTKKGNIQITNIEGKSITSELSRKTFDKNSAEAIFAKKILDFAELALGKAA